MLNTKKFLFKSLLKAKPTKITFIGHFSFRKNMNFLFLFYKVKNVRKLLNTLVTLIVK